MRRKGVLRNFIFGAEDSLVSTVGLLSGVSFAGLTSKALVTSGLILILVEAISMSVGVYISEDSANELDGEKDSVYSDSTVMFLSYIVMGLIPLTPYLKYGNTPTAFYFSITVTIVALFLLGLFKGFYVKIHPVKSALKISILGGVVILLAISVGRLIK
jgi:VIT1/CCC1 family predicted Fe2+/Mn2+ transporter